MSTGGKRHRTASQPRFASAAVPKGCYAGAMSRELRTYTFTVVVEPADEMWHAYCPTLLAYGAATWGTTREEVLAHIGEMAGMLVERLAEEGAPIPVTPDDQEPTAEERIVVTARASLEDAPHPA
jgi:predicted RNase H-like HicB family nuclease